MNQRGVAAVLVLAVGVCVAVLLSMREDGWQHVDPGLVVVVSETEVAITSSWTCNAERVRIVDSTSEHVEAVFERADQEVYLACGVGDCGVSMSPPGEAPNSVVASNCRHRFELTERLDGREIRVRCRSCGTGFARVQDER